MKTIKEVYEEYKAMESKSVIRDLLNKIRIDTDYEFTSGCADKTADSFKDVSGTLFINIHGDVWFFPPFKLQPRKWALGLRVDEPYDIVALVDGILYESPETMTRAEFVIASVECLSSELTVDFIKENWTKTGYGEEEFNQAVKDWESL
ncbi:hypothetical protein ASwh1_356 [Aeromonas phage Aswh_1]|nr:hypothetical protein ASwh1_356 [Aeromonas phage Aswh_1]